MAREVLFDKQYVKRDLKEGKERFLCISRWKVFPEEGTTHAKVWSKRSLYKEQHAYSRVGGGSVIADAYGELMLGQTMQTCQRYKGFEFYSK